METKLNKLRRFLITTLLILVVATTTTACSSSNATLPSPTMDRINAYTQLERGDSVAGQKFGDWIVSTSQGMVSDSFVRDNNKLGVVISDKVKPTEVKTLAKALATGFHRNFPNQDLTILMYAPNKERILTAKYDVQSNNIEYRG